VRSVLGLPGYHEFYKGKPITTMTYDWWVGRPGPQNDGTRFNLQEIFLSTLTNFLYDNGSGGSGPSWWGLAKKHAVSTWSRHIELLAMVEDTSDGEFYAVPQNGGAESAGPGPVKIGLINYAMSEQSIQIRQTANAVMASIVQRAGLARFMKLTESNGAYVAHPLGGCRMADSADLGVVNDRGAVYGYEGLYCIDSSIVPTSLGVNPSLTVAALSERCAEGLVRDAAGLGLPALPAGFAPGVPDEIVGDRVIPGAPPDPLPATPGRPRRRRRVRRRRRARHRRPAGRHRRPHRPRRRA